MAKKYLDQDGLLYVWQKITNAFVKKDGTKVLSTNDYTNAEKTKLAGIEEGANKTTVDSALSSTSTNPVQNTVVNAALGSKVDAVAGKGLSTNDLTDDLLAKLNNTASKVDEIATVGGEPNVIEIIKQNGSVLDVTNKTVNITVPTNNNQLSNGAGYITGINNVDVIEALGYTPYDSTNPSGYQNATQVNNAITSKGYITSTQAENLIDGKGYLTTIPSEYVTDNELTAKGYITEIRAEELITGKGYLTSIPSEYVTDGELTDKGYQTAAQVNSAITSKGYQTESQVNSLINTAIADITGIAYEVVTELPATGSAGVIYLISNGGPNPNIYDEYIYTNGSFEKIGTTDVDLSGYLQESDLAAITNSEIDTIVAN